MRIISGEFGGRQLKGSTGPKYSSSSIFLVIFDESCSTCLVEAGRCHEVPSLVGWTVRFYSRTIAFGTKIEQRNYKIASNLFKTTKRQRA